VQSDKADALLQKAQYGQHECRTYHFPCLQLTISVKFTHVKALLVRREVLIARSQQSNLTGNHCCHLSAFYVLRPAADCNSLLAKRCTSQICL